jgi:hypothetical protein
MLFTCILVLNKGVLEAMFANKLNPLCPLVLAFFFTAGFVFISENQAAVIQIKNNKKDEDDKKSKSFVQFQSEIIDVLKKLDPNPTNKEEYEKSVRRDLYKIIDKFSAKLRPNMGSKKYVSGDKTFVLVIAANGTGDEGEDELTTAIDNEAKIVMAIAGDGDPFVEDKPLSGTGGSAVARAKNGVIVALGGRGGVGGGRPGAAGGKGGIGSIVLTDGKTPVGLSIPRWNRQRNY